MSQDKIEGVSKVSEAYKTQAGEGPEKGSEQFQNLMDTNRSAIQPAFERLDAKNLAISGIETQNVEIQEIKLPDEDVSSHKIGSATDQEQKKRQGGGSDTEEVEGISGVEGAKKKGASGLDAAANMSSAGSSSESSSVGVEEIKKQTNEIVNKLEEAKSQLAQANDANLEIKPSYQKLLRNHLTHIDDNIKIASSKMGVEPTGEVKAVEAKGGSPTERFLNMLTRSQYEMNNLQKTIEAASASGTQMTPGQLLALQIKTNLITHEIELFTNLLNKALESVKTIMNVQV